MNRENSKSWMEDEAELNAREEALRSEEKIIMESLKKIRQRYNQLQMENLHIEGLKEELYREHLARFGTGGSAESGSNSTLESNPASINNARPDQDGEGYNELSMVLDQPAVAEHFQIIEENCNNLQLQDLSVDPLVVNPDQCEEFDLNLDMSMMDGCKKKNDANDED